MRNKMIDNRVTKSKLLLSWSMSGSNSEYTLLVNSLFHRSSRAFPLSNVLVSSSVCATLKSIFFSMLRHVAVLNCSQRTIKSIQYKNIYSLKSTDWLTSVVSLEEPVTLTLAMGGIMSLFSGLFGTKERRILILGLDGAGKTTILYRSVISPGK